MDDRFVLRWPEALLVTPGLVEPGTDGRTVALFVFLAAVLGFLGVAVGAFAAHALESRLSASSQATFETGVRYHLVHAVALLAVAWAAARWPGSATTLAGWSFVVGVLLFSGSLYVMSVSGVRGLGAITPFGGLAFLMGWAALAWAALGALRS